MLLPLGLVTEDAYTKPKDPHLMYLAHAALSAPPPPLPPSLPLRQMLPLIGDIQPIPLASCPFSCHRAGWCGVWYETWMPPEET